MENIQITKLKEAHGLIKSEPLAKHPDHRVAALYSNSIMFLTLLIQKLREPPTSWQDDWM
jgi:hypothetical protein